MTNKQINRKYYVGLIIIVILTTTFTVYNKTQEAITVSQFNRAHRILNDKTDNILYNTDSIKEELHEVGKDVNIIKTDVAEIKNDVKLIKDAVTEESNSNSNIYKGGIPW